MSYGFNVLARPFIQRKSGLLSIEEKEPGTKRPRLFEKMGVCPSCKAYEVSCRARTYQEVSYMRSCLLIRPLFPLLKAKILVPPRWRSLAATASATNCCYNILL
jgi:hypothetical protein